MWQITENDEVLEIKDSTPSIFEGILEDKETDHE